MAGTLTLPGMSVPHPNETLGYCERGFPQSTDGDPLNLTYLSNGFPALAEGGPGGCMSTSSESDEWSP